MHFSMILLPSARASSVDPVQLSGMKKEASVVSADRLAEVLWLLKCKAECAKWRVIYDLQRQTYTV